MTAAEQPAGALGDAVAALNTDRELFREDTGDPAGSYYENSVHVTAQGTIGMNVGGTVYTLPIAEWHALAAARLAAVPAAVDERAGVWGDGWCAGVADAASWTQGRDVKATPNPYSPATPPTQERPGD